MAALADEIPVEVYFDGFPESKVLYDTVIAALNDIGDFSERATKTQVSFRRRTGFGAAWIPYKHLGRTLAPLVLTVGLHRHDESPRWKQVVKVSANRFTHHMELYSPEQVDGEVRAWLREAWELAG